MANIVEKVKFAGTEVELQNMKLVLPLLNFAAYRKGGAMKKLNMVFEGVKRADATGIFDLTDEELDAAVDLVYMSAVRNYPDITKEQIMEGLDIENLSKILPVLVTTNVIPASAKAVAGKNA